ncbi:MAG: ATP-binding protein [Anaerolineae bacterium]
MRNSLLLRLTAAFALIILIALAAVYIVASQATSREFQYFMFRGQMLTEQDLVQQLADYYRQQGTWNGVDALLTRGSGGMMGGGGGMMGAGSMSAQLTLADARGVVIADTLGRRVGQTLTAAERQSGLPVVVNGQPVGTLLAGSSIAVADPSSQQFLDQVNRSVLFAALTAGLLALALGYLLFRQITAPLHALSAASTRIAAGDLAARVPVKGDDEVAQVGRSFNAMAGHLARSETARRNMLADVAHELRNPLGVLQSHLEAVQDGVLTADAEQIASLHDETLHLTHLVDDLRELALAEAGQLRLELQPTDLRALISRTLAAFQPQAAAREVELRASLAADLPPLDLDAHRIEQVLTNLLSNALRYTPTGGRIEVSLTAGPQAVRVEVRDSGPGIAPEDLSHLFERFWRADKSRTRTEGGAGLGLAIAKQWVEAHHGRIGVSSPPGQGATFWFELPQ